MIWLSLIYLFSRLPFLWTYPVFYDSFEYAKIAQTINLANFREIIISSHQPIHTFYFLTILIFKTIFSFLSLNVILVLISLVFGYLTMFFWFNFVKNFLDRERAFFASCLLLLFPYFFIANTNILYESELLFFQIAAIFFFRQGLKQEKIAKVFLAGILWGLSVSIFTGSLIIFPIFLVIFWQEKKKVVPLVLLVLLALLVPLAIDYLFLRSPQIILTKYQPHLADLVSAANGLPLLAFRLLRNIVLESSAILSWPGAILTAIVLLASILYLLSSTPIFYLPSSIFWFLPPLFLMQFWHAGLYGRLGLFIIFPASLILAKNLKKFWQKILVLLILLIPLIPHLLTQTRPPPIYQYYNLVKKEKNIVIITTDSNRFLYEQAKIPTFVLKHKESLPTLTLFINTNLKQDHQVLIDSMALLFPNNQFDGSFYHPLTKNKREPPYLLPLWQTYRSNEFLIDSQNPKIFFQKIFW